MDNTEYTNIEFIAFEDDLGNQIEMEIVDEFEYEEKKYVALVEAIAFSDDDADVTAEDEIQFFEVVSSDDGEEYNPVEDDALIGKLEDYLESRLMQS